MPEFRRLMVDGQVIAGRVDGSGLISDDGRRIGLDGAEHLSPIEPTKIIACHLNYRSRVDEFMTKLPRAPTYFHKPLTALNAHLGDVIRPKRCKYLNFEGEIGIVIGATTFNISQEEAEAHIAGYTIANDFGLHDFRDTDAGSMLRVKGSDTLCPLGPGLITEWDFHHKTIITLVNGVEKQSGNTSEMEWDMHYLVADIARSITLLPGDVILSGTPAGSRPVEPGDIVSVQVEGLGTLVNRIVEGDVGIRPEIGAQPSETEEVLSTALGGDWEFRGIRAPRGPGARHYESELDK